jgi:hypothetical protein
VRAAEEMTTLVKLAFLPGPVVGRED